MKNPQNDVCEKIIQQQNGFYLIIIRLILKFIKSLTKDILNEYYKIRSSPKSTVLQRILFKDAEYGNDIELEIKYKTKLKCDII